MSASDQHPGRCRLRGCLCADDDLLEACRQDVAELFERCGIRNIALGWWGVSRLCLLQKNGGNQSSRDGHAFGFGWLTGFSGASGQPTAHLLLIRATYPGMIASRSGL